MEQKEGDAAVIPRTWPGLGEAHQKIGAVIPRAARQRLPARERAFITNFSRSEQHTGCLI